jgi:hypothetical protein
LSSETKLSSGKEHKRMTKEIVYAVKRITQSVIGKSKIMGDFITHPLYNQSDSGFHVVLRNKSKTQSFPEDDFCFLDVKFDLDGFFYIFTKFLACIIKQICPKFL